ncbi:MAG: translocation/assembly module TamB domain-containing protein, partial [Synechocystis sp.]|nr:translocation/assembly module TamB domain-containing protein [Synechocystis sp.]
QAQLTGAIAPMPLLAAYNVKPDQITLGNLSFAGKVGGTLSNPQGTVQWQTADTNDLGGINFAAQGQATLVGQQFTLKDTQIRSSGGSLRLTGQGNFKQDRWQAQVSTQQFPLSPFIQAVCGLDNGPACPDAIRNKPLTLTAGRADLTGQLTQFDPNHWQGAGQFQFRSGGETAQINARLQRGQIQANVGAQNVAVNPYVDQLTTPVTVEQLTAQTQLPLAPLLNGQLPLQQLSLQSQLRASVDNRPVTATTQMERGQLQTQARVDNIALNSFLPALPVATRLTQGRVNARAFLGDIQTPADLQRLGLDRVNADARLRLTVADSPVSVKSELQRGSLTAIADVGRLSLNALAPQLPVPAQVDRGNISLIADVKDLLKPQPDLGQVEAIAAVDLTVADGKVTTLSRLENFAWQSRITAQNLDLEPYLLSQGSQADGGLDSIDAQASLAGNLNTLFTPQGRLGSLPIIVQQSKITSGNQQVTAQGRVVVGNLAQRPQLNTVNLAVQSQINLAPLPINEAIARLPIAEEFKPASLDLVGKTQFAGNLTGQAVTALADLKLTGQVTVTNLALNDYQFEPRLTGPLSAQFGQPISLNLQGNQDQLAFNIKPCRGKCLSPYLPTSFSLRQAYNRPEPILAQGQLNGDRLTVDIDQFPLAILNVRPARRYNIAGRLEGDLQAQMTVDLRDGNGRGNLVVDDLKVGYLGVDELNADLAYQNQLLRLNQGHVIIGESQYNATAALNFKTQEIEGNVAVEQAQISKLLTALRISNVESFLRLAQLQKPLPTLANDIEPINVGDPNQALENQLNLLYLIDQQIIALAQQYEKGGVPTELNIVGTFDANINLDGTLQRPEVGVNLEGNDWSWYPQDVFPNIIPPLGLVLNETRFLPIREVKLQAQLKDGQLAILPSFVQIKNSRLGAEGVLSPQQSRLQWVIKDFDSDILESFVQLPGAVAGRLNAQGEIVGTPADPRLSGVFRFDEIALNARPVAEVVGGQFNYQDNRLQVVTSEESPLYFNAQVPFYWNAEAAKKSDRPQTFQAELDIPPDSLELLDVVSQEQVVWLSGDGQANLKVQGELNQEDGIKIENLKALGKVTLTNAVVKSAALPTPVEINGEIYFNNTAIAIQQLTGQLDQSRIDIAGVLPIFDPQPNLENPLQISIKPTRINLTNLYAGNVAGLITVEGAAFKPSITGDVQLTDGQIFLPDRTKDASEPDQLAELRAKLGWFKPRRPSPLISPNLDNLNISLRNLYLEQDPLYEFSFGGDFKVSGPVLDFAALSADGAIQLNRGRVSFFDTRFLLDRRSPNTITFKPNQDLLNPNLNIAMRTIVSDLPQSARMRSENTNEYPDDSLNQIQRVDIRLLIDGNLGQILPNLNSRYAAVCDPTVTFRPLPGVGSFDEFQLDRLSRCLQILAAQGFDNEQIFSNPAIQLTSSPPRSEGEIVRLLGEQVIVLVDALQGKNSSQLLQVGITQLAIPMIFQGLVYDVETAISETVESTDFRIVPFLEAIYEVEEQGYVRFTYDYSFNEFRVRYEKQF